MLEFLKAIKDALDMTGNILEDTGESLKISADAKAAAQENKKVASFLEKLGNAFTRMQYKSPLMQKAVVYSKQAFKFIFSEKVARTLGVSLAGFAFASAAATPPIALAFLAVSTIGFTAKVVSSIIQKRNLSKTEDEARSLERLIENKHRIIDAAHKLGLQPKLAKAIGLGSMTLPENHDKKLSKIHRDSLLQKLQNKTLDPATRRQLIAHLDALNRQVISSQKYETGRSTYMNAAQKVFLSTGTKLTGDLATAAANIANPIGLGITTIASAAGLLSDIRTRQQLSDQKQALKNSIELFRQRLDVPGYDNLDELHLHSRKAELEAKALERLQANEEFKEDIKQENVAKLQQAVQEMKHQIIFEERAIASSKPLQQLKQQQKEATQKLINHTLYKQYDEYRALSSAKLIAIGIKAPTEKQILQAMKELASIDAEKTIEKQYNQDHLRALAEARTNGQKAYAAYTRSGNKTPDIISSYERQDHQTKWDTLKRFISDITEAFNFFSRDKLTIAKPHKLLVTNHLSSFAIHKDEHDLSHAQAKAQFEKARVAVLSVHENMIKKTLLSPYAISARQILARPASQKVHKSQGITY
jgi:hypothetical protein